MSGLEKMKSQILDEANHSAETKIAEAKLKAEEILNAAKAEAKAQALKISGKAQADVENYAQRITSSCEMQRKQAILRAKQEVIAEVLDKAYRKILSLDTEAYFEMIQKMLGEFVLAQDGEICFSAEDLNRMPAGFEDVIHNAAAKKGGSLNLSRETREMKGGFILIYGGIEENCTVKALFDAKRDELSDKVHAMLFG